MMKTPSKSPRAVLIVDDEPGILKALGRVFRGENFQVVSAGNGEEALNYLKARDRVISLIISDQKMPGMNGWVFLEKARTIVPDAIRFLLTGYSEMDSVIQAVNKGQIHKYLTKPWNDDELILQVREAQKQFELGMENKRLQALTSMQNKQLRKLNDNLEEQVQKKVREIWKKNEELSRLNKEIETSFFNVVRSFGSLLHAQVPVLAGHGRRVSNHARGVGRLLGVSEKTMINIEMAALLHDVGQRSADAPFGAPVSSLSKADFAAYLRHPEEGQTMVRIIEQLDAAGLMIRSHHEQFDGLGFPDGLAGNDIPLGGRIISVCDAYDRIVHLEHENSEVVAEFKSRNKSTASMKRDFVVRMAAKEHLKANSGAKFDPEIVEAFLEVLKNLSEAPSRELVVNIKSVRPGMILSRPLYSARGQYLLPDDTVLTSRHISKLRIIAGHGGLGKLLVLNPEKMESGRSG